MAPTVAVIIPALDESARIEGAVASALAAAADEVIVVDGGSRDDTAERARRSGASTVLHSPPPRGRQLNLAASTTKADILLFLHADTRLPPGAIGDVRAAIEGGASFGAFSISFLEPGWRLRLAERLINLRSRLRFSPWGDQGQFIRREVFLEMGGFRDIALMEDLDLADRMRRRGKTALLSSPVRTSGRRFLERGFLRTAITNWLLVAAYRLGVDPDRLGRFYRRTTRAKLTGSPAPGRGSASPSSSGGRAPGQH